MRILFISYFYPPLGGPGVQRPIKTIKYLKEYGWEIDVLTVDQIQFHSYDYKLLEESRADNIYRTRSLDLMSLIRKKKKVSPSKPTSKKLHFLYFYTPESIKKIIRGLFPIDDKIGWLPYAYKTGLKLLKNNHYDCIFATIGPYTAGVLAYYLNKKTSIPYFIDYRDHWTLHAYPKYKLKILHRQAEYYERKMLENAKGIFIIGLEKKQMLAQKFGNFIKEKTEVVYNGFDEDDFNNIGNRLSVVASGNTAPFFIPEQKIRYVGNIYGNQSIEYFVQTLDFMKQKNEIPENVKFEFIGNYYLETINVLKSNSLSSFINVIPQVDHVEAVQYMQTADLLLLFVSSKEGNSTIPGKTFEYMRTTVPILAMIPPQSEIATILTKYGHKYICPMEDKEKIREYLLEFFLGVGSGEWGVGSSTPNYDMQYSREIQTKILDKYIKERLND